MASTSAQPPPPPSCPLQRALRKCNSNVSRTGTGQHRTCQEPLYVIAIDRYMRDANFALFFQGSIHASDSLFDATLTDGDCKIRVAIDPRLNYLISKNQFRCGSSLKNVELLVEDNAENGNTDIVVTNLELDQQSEDAALRALAEVNVKSLPWWAGEKPSSLPLRARRAVYLPLWNDHDFSGDMWRDNDDGTSELSTTSRAPVSLRQMRERFLSDGSRIRGDVRVRVLKKSRLMHYGKAEQNCLYPYRAELQVADESANVSVVLWNAMCVEWYRRLHPGMVLRLSRFRVRESFSHRTGQKPEPDIEISLNSSHPSAIISIVSPESPEWHLPSVPQDFCKGADLQSSSHGSICDVVGLVVFVGRPECIKTKAEGKMDTFRWIQLEDGTSEEPVLVKLFSTSQPDVHTTIQPMAVFVCTRLQVMKGSSQFCYLTNTPYTQVYCTGTGTPLTIPYKGIRPFRQFLQWLDQIDEEEVMKRSVVGGHFSYPPPPASLKAFMDERKAQSALVSGQELQVLCEKLQYRESQRFCVQCTICAVDYHHQDDAQRTSLSSPPLTTPPCPSEPQTLKRSPRVQKRPNLITAGTPRKRLFLPSADPEEISDSDLSLFDSAMEFLMGDEKDLDDAGTDEDSDGESFITANSDPSCSFSLSQAAMETIPRSFCYRRRHVQASAVGLQPGSFQKLLPFKELDSFNPASFYRGHYTLQLRALSDRVQVNALFLPASLETNHWRPLPHHHGNSWESILSHGGFSPHSPPPTPADLLATKAQLVNQKFVCVLDACQLGRNRLEVVLSRAFPLQN